MNRDERAPPWHALEVDEVLRILRAPPGGLSHKEAAQRKARFGPNRLPRAPAAPLWRTFARQFISPLIVVLGFAAALSLAIGDALDALFIGVVLVLNATIGGTQEWRAERSAQSLRRLMPFRATVERDAELHEIDATDVVPGDSLRLEPGNRVPADARLLSATGLEVDESLLTGESAPVGKAPDSVVAPETALADRRNMVHAGTVIVRGRGKAAVTGTGASSAVGQLAIDVMGTPPGRPPLLLRLDRLSRHIGAVSLGAAFVVAVLGVVGQGREAVQMALFGVALAVSVIPEGLPVAITVALAVASTRMARRGAIVRRLGAVEGLGSCTLIASDKTGTLTCNQLTAREARLPDGARFTVTGEGFDPRGVVEPGPDAHAHASLSTLAIAAALCNEADLHEREGRWTWRGDPTDVALLTLARKLGVNPDTTRDDHPQLNQIPFEPERRFAASFNRFGAAVKALVKGAPERVFAMCAPDDAGEVDRARRDAEDMAAAGMRVIAIAEGDAPGEVGPEVAPSQPARLRVLGLVGMIDPLRPGVIDATRACASAGVRVCMVTGDHPTTALAIARELGLADHPSQVVTGDAFEKMSDAEVAASIGRVRVFARVAPHQKLRIVQAAQSVGHFVAVTGDGANDAPALRAANIGVAMGLSGTDVAREASDLVIADDNFVTIVAGVQEGRIAYDNVRKVIYMLLSTGAAEVIATAGAVVAGLPLPLLPVQLLWLNLVTNGIQDVALAFEPGESGVLARAPRPPHEPIFDRLMIERTLIAAAVMGGVCLGAFWWMLDSGWPESDARNVLLLLMVLFENVHMGNCRSETRSALIVSPLRSPVLLSGTLGALLVHVGAMHAPWLSAVLDTAPVSGRTWGVLLALSLSVFIASELHKLWWRHRHAR
jgi:magnesium-transporting ATPase (P-type)